MSRERACRDMEELLVLYHYGELSPKERLGVEAHLDGCGNCIRELASIREALESAPRYAPTSAEVRDAVNGVMSAVVSPARQWWKRRMVPYFAAAAAAAAIVLSVYLPDIIQNKQPRENPVMAQADWELLENMDIAKDYIVIEELDSFEGLDEQL